MLEMGAFAEADVLDTIRNSVPADLASQIPVTHAPSTNAPPANTYPSTTAPLSTSKGSVVTDMGSLDFDE